jgi:hypothetical protein
MTITHAETRYYQTPPEEKTVQQCASHGDDHAAYGWSKQLDPRWSEEQVAAYREAYAKGIEAKKSRILDHK